MASDGGTNAAIADMFTTHAIDLLRLEAAERRAVRRFLEELEAEIAAAIAKIDPTAPARQSYRVRRLEKLLEQVKDTIRASYRGTARYLAGELAELADIEVDFVTRALNNGIGFDMASASITRETARSLVAGVLVHGAPVAEWWSRQAGDTFERFQDAMRHGIAQGETNAQLIRRVRGGRQNGEQVVGFMDVTRRNAESLVRSATQAVSERARQEAYEQNADILSAVVWTSTLDARTTVLCMVRDGLRYSVPDHKPIGHDVPWLSGPGNLHWGALAEGSLIRTETGLTQIEDVRKGDKVLTHDGSWSVVTATLRKRAQHGVMRVAHMKSGRVLRATYDHPVFKAGSGWVFMGRLQAGDKLCSDPYGMEEIIGASSGVVSEPEDSPSGVNQSDVALQRTLQFVATKIGFKCGLDVRPREIEDRAIAMVLADPMGVYRDQSALHHHFALAHVLGQIGLQRLGRVLALLLCSGAAVDLGKAIKQAVSFVGLNNARKYFGVVDRVLLSHPLGVSSIVGVGVLGVAESPMIRAGGIDYSPSGVIKPDLLDLVPDRDRMALGVAGKCAVSQTFLALNAAQGDAVSDVAAFNEFSQERVNLGHDEVSSIRVQTETEYVYDLEVQGNSSYFANGVAVSNCRSSSRPETKSWRELGFDIDDLPPGTRASMDGQVAGDTTFEAWLSRQSKAAQDAALGTGRAELWRNGTITFRQLLDANGRELTLDELRARVRS